MKPTAEPAAADRAVEPRCGACLAAAPVLLHRTTVRDVGVVWLCLDPVECRRRAQQAGIWCHA